jgi:hypothetical protein
MNQLKTGVTLGLAMLASLYANPPATNQPTEKSDEKLSQLGFGQAQGEEHLYLANIRARSTGEITEQFHGKSVAEIETLAENLGYEVEWVNA